MTMPFTSAEKQRHYRERRKLNLEKEEENKSKDRTRGKRRASIKQESLLDQQARRLLWKISKRQYRLRKKALEQQPSVLDTPRTSGYSFVQSETIPSKSGHSPVGSAQCGYSTDIVCGREDSMSAKSPEPSLSNQDNNATNNGNEDSMDSKDTSIDLVDDDVEKEQTSPCSYTSSPENNVILSASQAFLDAIEALEKRASVLEEDLRKLSSSIS